MIFLGISISMQLKIVVFVFNGLAGSYIKQCIVGQKKKREHFMQFNLKIVTNKKKKTEIAIQLNFKFSFILC